MFWLLRSQSKNGVNGRGAARRQPGSRESRGSQDENHACKRHAIVGLNSEDVAPDERGCEPSKDAAQGQSNAYQRQSASQNEAEDGSMRSAESEPHADLAGALRHHKRKQAVQTNGGDHDGKA